MQPNIGLVDRYVRLTSGLLAFGAGLGLRRSHALAKAALLAFGAMKIAEGVTGFCPVMYAAGVRSVRPPSPQAGADGSLNAAPGESGHAKSKNKKVSGHRDNQRLPEVPAAEAAAGADHQTRAAH